MNRKRLLWTPVFATALLMYFARVSHIAVLNYNLFLALLLLWSGAVIGFFRIFAGPGVRRSRLLK